MLDRDGPRRSTSQVEETADGSASNLPARTARCCSRATGEPLKALQHIVDTGFGRELDDDRSVFVDCLDYRKGKDVELRQMAKFLDGEGEAPGLDQQLGPLNPYERRIVHLAVAEDPAMTTESIGDAFSKTVIISREVGAEPVLASCASSSRRHPPMPMFSTTDTIVAIATPPGRGGIGVVRLSGPRRARDRAARSTGARRALEPRHATFAHVVAIARRTGARSIRSSSRYFPAPHSYTGEDVVEISAHGSPVVLRRDRRGGDRRAARGWRSRASSRCARF